MITEEPVSTKLLAKKSDRPTVPSTPRKIMIIG